MGRPDRRAAIIGEVSEMFMASKDNGWYEPTSLSKGGDEGSRGEGLSRFLTDQMALRLGVTTGFAGYDIVDQWLNLAVRPNFVDSAPDDHGFDQVVGCTTCFIYYLYSQLGYGITDIINAGAPTLGGVYQKLTGRTDGWQSFIDLVNPHFSAGNLDSLVDVQAQPVPGAQRSVAIHVSHAGQTLSAPVTVLPRPSILQGVVRDAATEVRLANAVGLIDDGDISGHEHMQLLTDSDGS